MKIVLILLVTISFIYAQNLKKENITHPKPIQLTQVNMRNLSDGTSSLSYTFKVGNDPEIYHAGYFGDGIRPFITSNKNAIAELDEFKSKRITSVYGYAGVFVFMGVGIAVGLNKGTGEMVYDPRQGKVIEKQKGNPVGLTFVGLSLVSLIIGGYNYFSAADHMINSVRIFNSDSNDQTQNLKYRITPVFEDGKSLLCFSLSW